MTNDPSNPPLENSAPQNALRIDSDPPTPSPDPENASTGVLGAANGNPEAGDAHSDTPEEKRIARALAQAAKAERKAKDRERRASELAEKAQREREAALKEKEAAEALIREASTDPSKAKALLEKAGLTMETLAQLYLGIPNSRSVEDEIADLKRQLNERAEQEKKQAEDKAKAEQQARFQTMVQRDLSKIHSALEKTPDKYEMIQTQAAQGELLDRIYRFVSEHKIRSVTAEEESLLVQHFADELENELTDRARADLERLTKLKKLGIQANPGITTHNSQKLQDTSDKLGAAAEEILQRTTRDRKPSKFITNETTISNKPLPQDITRYGRKDDALIEEAVRALRS